MINVITAMGNPYLNENLKKDNEIKIILNDIQYQEGIFEILEKEKNINYLILNEFLPGEFTIKKLIEKIKLINEEIKIIIILENRKKEIEYNLNKNDVYKILYNSEVEINEIIKIIKNNENDLNQNFNNSENQELKKEIENLKKIILENQKINNVFLNNQKINFHEKQINNKLKNNKNKIENKKIAKLS